MITSNDRVDAKAALKVLSSDGPLAANLKGFEPRYEQQQMMSNVLDAYNKKQIALIEAGTGTGKSLAYLIPAMLWAVHTKERTVISTNTITLQEQLLQKDIPIVEKALRINLKAVLVKGMQNYVCLHKLNEATQEKLLLLPNELEEIQKIEVWAEGKHDGSRSALSFSPSSQVWEKVGAESDTCNRNKCPHYDHCFFFKARKQANEAQILIVNHHLLFADLVCRMENDKYDDTAILPHYNNIVLDEAHNIEDIATEYFASRISQLDLIRLLGRLTSEKSGKMHGKLPILREKLLSHYKNNLPQEASSIHHRLLFDLPNMRSELLKKIQEAFNTYFEFTQLIQTKEIDETTGGESKLRLLSYHQTHPYWHGRVVPQTKELFASIRSFSQVLSALLNDLKGLKNENLEEQLKGIAFEIDALAARLLNYGIVLEKFIAQIPENKVRWIELQQLKTMINITLVDAELDVSKMLAEFLFKKFHTVVLCSATLTTNNHFQFIRSRLGLTESLIPEKIMKEYIYQSPFNFSQQALLTIPTDIPHPNDSSFTTIAAEKIWQALLSSRGNAFVLFTSYTMLKTCYDLLEKRLKEMRFIPMKQGDADRQFLLTQFKANEHSILFATDSFWEGVDVAGDALRCVIIVKLPFKVPSDPLIQARSESIIARGGDPFRDYSLPQAIVKFKQGFGRLIRNRHDRGCIVCLDNRLTTKQYGQQFLSSLPDCKRTFVTGNALQEQMTEFYRKTHFLTLC